jgi:hypothetical protein
MISRPKPGSFNSWSDPEKRKDERDKKGGEGRIIRVHPCPICLLPLDLSQI